MTNEEARAYFIDRNEGIISVAKDENMYNYETQQIEYVFMRRDFEATKLAIKALEQHPCEDCVSREDALKAIEEQKKGFYGVERYAIDECHSAVMKLPPVTPSYNSIKTELKPCEDCIRELIREFDNKHPALFADYMQEFNNHPISEIIDYMWDMHDLIEDIEYRLPDEGGTESK